MNFAVLQSATVGVVSRFSATKIWLRGSPFTSVKLPPPTSVLPSGEMAIVQPITLPPTRGTVALIWNVLSIAPVEALTRANRSWPVLLM